MDVRLRRSERRSGQTDGRRVRSRFRARPATGLRAWTMSGSVRLLGEWQAQRAPRIARRFPECRGLSARAARGHLPGDARGVARQTLPPRGASAQRATWASSTVHCICTATSAGEGDPRSKTRRATARDGRASAKVSTRPERAALLHEDHLIVAEFLAELSEVERCVFGWLAEGMQYRGDRVALRGIEVNARAKPRARASESASTSSCSTTRGDYAGFAPRRSARCRPAKRQATELAARAFAHLEGCAHCRAEHKTNARGCGGASRARPPRCCHPRYSSAASGGSRGPQCARGCCNTGSCPDGPPSGPGGVENAQ